MKKPAIVFSAFVLTATLYFGGQVLADGKEKEAVKIPLNNYIKGLETKKQIFIKKALHSKGRAMSSREGKYTAVRFRDFIARIGGPSVWPKGKPKPSVETVDVFGDAAIGKIVVDHPLVKVVYYMSLLKINGEWKIVNKTYSVLQKKTK